MTLISYLHFRKITSQRKVIKVLNWGLLKDITLLKTRRCLTTGMNRLQQKMLLNDRKCQKIAKISGMVMIHLTYLTFVLSIAN